jgi:hypothetical protein
MSPKSLVTLLVVAFMASSLSYAGWFSDSDFYVIEQQSPYGKLIDGWVSQGAPKNVSGVYIFTIYGTKIEKRIPIQGTVVTCVGTKAEYGYKMLSRDRDDAAGKIPKGF